VKARIVYRISAVLLVLFAAGHTFGFRQNNPEWGAEAVLASMRSVHFDAQGFTRTYWDFFSAFGLFFSVFLLFSAALAWLLGGLPAETLSGVRSIAWALAICFAAVTALSFRYAFTTPLVFSALITVCLIAAASLSAKTG
jgi:Sec-independent protein secretion pathway component TatC